MIPLVALGSVSKAVDALSSGASWLSKQLSSDKDDTASTAASPTLPKSFASLLAAHGVGDASAGKVANPTLPNVSAAGHAHAGTQRVGHFG